jgi:hypothetical protein
MRPGRGSTEAVDAARYPLSVMDVDSALLPALEPFLRAASGVAADASGAGPVR